MTFFDMVDPFQIVESLSHARHKLLTGAKWVHRRRVPSFVSRFTAAAILEANTSSNGGESAADRPPTPLMISS
jgi:hypothetical protein